MAKTQHPAQTQASAFDREPAGASRVQSVMDFGDNSAMLEQLQGASGQGRGDGLQLNNGGGQAATKAAPREGDDKDSRRLVDQVLKAVLVEADRVLAVSDDARAWPGPMDRLQENLSFLVRSLVTTATRPGGLPGTLSQADGKRYHRGMERASAALAMIGDTPVAEWPAYAAAAQSMRFARETVGLPSDTGDPKRKHRPKRRSGTDLEHVEKMFFAAAATVSNGLTGLEGGGNPRIMSIQLDFMLDQIRNYKSGVLESETTDEIWTRPSGRTKTVQARMAKTVKAMVGRMESLVLKGTALDLVERFNFLADYLPGVSGVAKWMYENKRAASEEKSQRDAGGGESGRAGEAGDVSAEETLARELKDGIAAWHGFVSEVEGHMKSYGRLPKGVREKARRLTKVAKNIEKVAGGVASGLDEAGKALELATSIWNFAAAFEDVRPGDEQYRHKVVVFNDAFAEFHKAAKPYIGSLKKGLKAAARRGGSVAARATIVLGYVDFMVTMFNEGLAAGLRVVNYYIDRKNQEIDYLTEQG